MAIPRHAFFVWLAIKNGLANQDKLQKWGLIPQAKCLMCNDPIHLSLILFLTSD